MPPKDIQEVFQEAAEKGEQYAYDAEGPFVGANWLSSTLRKATRAPREKEEKKRAYKPRKKPATPVAPGDVVECRLGCTYPLRISGGPSTGQQPEKASIEVILRLRLEGYSVREIADQLGYKSTSPVRRRILEFYRKQGHRGGLERAVTKRAC